MADTPRIQKTSRTPQSEAAFPLFRERAASSQFEDTMSRTIRFNGKAVDINSPAPTLKKVASLDLGTTVGLTNVNFATSIVNYSTVGPVIVAVGEDVGETIDMRNQNSTSTIWLARSVLANASPGLPNSSNTDKTIDFGPQAMRRLSSSGRVAIYAAAPIGNSATELDLIVTVTYKNIG